MESLTDAGEAVTTIIEHGADTPDTPLFLLLELADVDKSMVDILVEVVLAGLQMSGLWNSSILMLLPTQPSLRGDLGSLYEGGVHLEALLASPLIPLELQNSTSDLLLHTVDLFPSLLEASSSSLPPPTNIDGISQWITLTDLSLPSVAFSTPVREEVVLGLDTSKRAGAIRRGNLKLIVNPSEWPGWKTVVKETSRNASEDLLSCSEEDVEFAGHGIRKNRVNNVESAQDCQAQCQSRSECKYWTWNSGSYPVLKNTCWLKASNAGRQVRRSVSQKRKLVSKYPGETRQGVRREGLWGESGRKGKRESWLL